MPFTENLRRLRLDQFLSQAELARRAGLHALTITRLEAGTTAPSTRTVRALAAALGVRPGELATPSEVAELRGGLRAAAPPEGIVSAHPESRDAERGAASDGAGPQSS